MSWARFQAAEPEFAAVVRAKFETGRHKTIATLRADGSPRISGIECTFDDDRLSFGSMPGARKGADIHRDGRVAIHGPADHPAEGAEAEWAGEAKIAGRAVPAGSVPVQPDGSQPEGEMFEVDIEEVAVTGLDESGTKLLIQFWTPAGGLKRVERS